MTVDCTMTGALVAVLHRRRADFKRTNHVLNRLSLYAVISTALDTALIVPAFVLVLIRPDNWIWVAIITPVTKVLSNSVLIMLNFRTSLREELHKNAGTVPISIPIGNASAPRGTSVLVVGKPASHIQCEPDCEEEGLRRGHLVSSEAQPQDSDIPG
ncbi:hypothetical protein C8Q74DRAFT_120364 [Fomes fomentarius]|nr:hypothetical protein C8Q74DRAFT_120364 [Fomes fomentarius]